MSSRTWQLQRALARELAPVKTLQDFYRVQGEKNKGLDAFRKLRSQAQAEFISSLVFSDKGLASYNFKVIEDSLSVTEAYELLSLFGVQDTIRHLKGLKVKTTADLLIQRKHMTPLSCCEESEENEKGYRCSSPGTCSMSQTQICTDNC